MINFNTYEAKLVHESRLYEMETKQRNCPTVSRKQQKKKR